MPPIRHFESSNLLCYRSREGTLLVTEQFAFQQVKRNSRAIQLDERTSAPRACFVNGMGDQLLACAGLALNQNGGCQWAQHIRLAQARIQAQGCSR